MILVFSDPGCRFPDEHVGVTGVFVCRTEHRTEKAALQAYITHDERRRMAGNRRSPIDGLFQGSITVLVNLAVYG